jgi:exopolysaccharide biosynthesis polyprenyl glycosylphosphotransferase
MPADRPEQIRPVLDQPVLDEHVLDQPGSGLPGRGLAGPGPAAARDGRLSRAGALVPALALPVADAVALAAAAAVTVHTTAASPGAAALYGVAALVALAAGGLHRLRISLRVLDQTGRILAAVVLPLLVVLPLAPAAAAVRLGLVSAGLVVAFRLVTSTLLRAGRRRGALAEPAIIVGAGTFGAYLAEQLRLHPELGLRVRGFLDAGAPRRDLPEPTIGTPADLALVVAALGIRRVIVCFGDWRDEDLVPILRSAHGLAADVCVVPRLYELGLAVPRGVLDEVWGIPLVPLRRAGRAAAARGLKRAIDIAGSAVLLTLALPVLAGLAVATWWQTGQSPIFRQRRVTGNGRQAEVLKLRTLAAPPGGGHDPDTSWAVDARQCTPMGRLLRATHLDELPQLVNVLRGDMSLVGPRPERAYFAEQFAAQIPRYADRDRAKAGLTGWAQVHGLHGDTSIAERSRFDNQYIEYWSPWLDLVILIRTLGSALTGLTGGQKP